MRVVVVLALLAAVAACGGAGEAPDSQGGSGGFDQPEGGTGGTDVAQGGGGSGGVVHPASRFDGECIDPTVPRSTSTVNPLPVQFRHKPRDGMGLVCVGYLLEPRPGGADLVVYALTTEETAWLAELGEDPRMTSPLHCTDGEGGQACLASFPADGEWRSVLIRLTRGGVCAGSLRLDLNVDEAGAQSGQPLLDSTDCP